MSGLISSISITEKQRVFNKVVKDRSSGEVVLHCSKCPNTFIDFTLHRRKIKLDGRVCPDCAREHRRTYAREKAREKREQEKQSVISD